MVDSHLEEALEVLIEQANQRNAPTFTYKQDWNIELKNNKICYSDNNNEIILEPLNIHGDFQLYNLGLAIASVMQTEATHVDAALKKKLPS